MVVGYWQPVAIGRHSDLSGCSLQRAGHWRTQSMFGGVRIKGAFSHVAATAEESLPGLAPDEIFFGQAIRKANLSIGSVYLAAPHRCSLISKKGSTSWKRNDR